MQRQSTCAALAFALVWGTGALAGAQGSALVTPTLVRIEIPLGRSTSEPWRWNDAATATGRAEYVWSAVLDGDTTHAIGFMLFKRPGASPAQGHFAELLRAGQASLWLVMGHRERVVPRVRPTLRGEDSSLVVELHDSAVIATVFARRPQYVTFKTLSPYQPFKSRKVLVQYVAEDRM